MGELTSELSPQIQTGSRPKRWEERFVIKRFDEESIEITLEQRNFILKALSAGDAYVQVGKYTLMVKSIKSIDPLWGEDNIPPRPDMLPSITEPGKILNMKEIEEWDSLFGKKAYGIQTYKK